jgi:hypothetical protein
MRRPNNWREKREEYYVYGELLADGTYEDDYTAGFEAGADAMLEALTVGSFLIAPDTESLVIPVKKGTRGRLLFIPDEE